MEVPVTFEHQGKIHKGEFSSDKGAGNGLWHLMIGNYYQGQMFYSEGGTVGRINLIAENLMNYLTTLKRI
jgi:hypothetical protein